MFIKGCIGDLCHLPVVDPCYIFLGGCALLVLNVRSVVDGAIYV